MSTLEQIARFWAWVNHERQRQDISFRAIERMSGMSNGTISGRESAMKRPLFDHCEAIAKALNWPLEDVLRRAGMLPPIPEHDRERQELLFYYEQMIKPEQKQFRMMARAVAESRRGYEEDEDEDLGTEAGDSLAPA